MRLIVMLLALSAVGCERLQKPKAPKEVKKEQQNQKQKFQVTAIKPINSNQWRWVMCTIGSKAYTNPSAG